MAKNLKPHQLVAENLRQTIYGVGLGPGTRILQVGASNGSGGDPVYPLVRMHTRCIFYRVEPRIDQFEKLVKLHKDDDNVLVHQCAIIPDDWEEGPTKMWHYAADSALPEWTEGVASLNEGFPKRNNEWRMKKGGVPAEIEETTVLGQHLTTAMTEMSLRFPEVVVTDMEAHDHLVFLPLMETAKVVCYEHKCYTETDNNNWAMKFTEAGFTMAYKGLEDIIWGRK